MSLFKELSLLLDKITEFYPYIEMEETSWCKDNYEIYWLGEECTYSGEIKEGVHYQDGCVFINIDNSCGETITKVFLAEKEMTWEDFEEEYEEWM